LLRSALLSIFLASSVSYAAVDKAAVPKASAVVAAFAGTVSDATGAGISGAQVALHSRFQAEYP
jgi:hypothetical protein